MNNLRRMVCGDIGVLARRVDDTAGVHSALAEALADHSGPRLVVLS
jgi:hypothetical protein